MDLTVSGQDQAKFMLRILSRLFHQPSLGVVCGLDSIWSRLGKIHTKNIVKVVPLIFLGGGLDSILLGPGKIQKKSLANFMHGNLTFCFLQR